METPSAMRRVTRSQASIPSHKKMQESEASVDKKKQDRSVLVDITNDSPIVGLAAGGSHRTPVSSVAKSRRAPLPKKTPGSGEVLLRGQVKSLLQKVEEESELVKLPSSSEDQTAPFRALIKHIQSPGGLVALTPANTPLILGLPAVQEQSSTKMSQVSSSSICPTVFPPEGEDKLAESQINRALLFDSPEKSEISTSPPLTCQDKKSFDADSSSIWSVEVNVSSDKEDDEEDEEYIIDEDGSLLLDDLCDKEDDEEDEEYIIDEDGSLLLDNLCDGLMSMTMAGEKESKGLPEFAGKHTRFVYNSEDEIEGEEEVDDGTKKKDPISPSVVVLKGLPVPEGKHLRFHQDEEED